MVVVISTRRHRTVNRLISDELARNPQTGLLERKGVILLTCQSCTVSVAGKYGYPAGNKTQEELERELDSFDC